MHFLATFLVLVLTLPVWADQPITSKTLFVKKLTSADDFEKLALPAQGVIRQGKTIKFLIDARNKTKPEIYYLNANYCPKSSCSSRPSEAILHYPFAKKALPGFTISEDDYKETTYFSAQVADRDYYDARVQEMIYTTPEGEDRQIYAVSFIERDLINEEMVKYALDVLQPAFFPGAPLVFIINSQHHTVGRVRAQIEAMGIGVLTMEEIISNINYIGLNPGEAYGYLRFAPSDPDDLEPYEIPVFEQLPLELAVVAGTITTTYQDVGSHVNLKSKERGTPNMVLRDAAKIADLKARDGQPVRLTVTYEGFTVEASTTEKVMEVYAKKTEGPWRKPSFEAETKMVDFDLMCSKSRPRDCLKGAVRYGGKVSGMGFLAHPDVAGFGGKLQKAIGYRLSPLGFGVPLSVYVEFVKHNSAKNPEFKAALEELIDSEMSLNGRSPLPTPQKKELIAKVKQLFLNGEIPEALYTAIGDQMAVLRKNTSAAYGVAIEKVKVRSSANTEDIEGFNGAGLHDSYSSKLLDYRKQVTECHYELEYDEDTGLMGYDVKPKNLACAIKGAFASLWNLSAVRERSYRKFDHRYASMGVAIMPTYKFRPGTSIVANSVLITRVVGTEIVYGQQLSTQLGNGLVTNPVSGTKAELATITFDASAEHIAVNVLQYAKPVATGPVRTETVMPIEKMLTHSQIARHVEIQYCNSKPEYKLPGVDCRYIVNSTRKKMALDMEFKTFNDGQILIKQVRTFYGK